MRRSDTLSQMATPTEILAVLDGVAERFEFPGFNNMNYATADSRLHCFRDGPRWALLIEELVDWPGADGLVTVAFAMGDIRGESLTMFAPIATRLDWDPTSGRLIVPDEVVLRGSAVKVDAAALEAATAEHAIEASFALLLQLIAAHRDGLFCTEAELAERVAPGLVRVLTLDSWAHPDVYGGPKPSESETFRQLAEVLATGDVRHYTPTQPPNNRDWKAWLASR